MKSKVFKRLAVITLLVVTVLLSTNQYLTSANNKEDQLGNKSLTYAKGYVIDELTGEKCVNAKITYSSIDDGTSKIIKTDKDGAFEIKDILTGYYNWRVDAEGYKSGTYSSYPVITGGNNYSFELSKTTDVSLTFTRQEQTSGAAEKEVAFNDLFNIQKDNSTSGVIPMAPGAPTAYVPTTVKVKLASGSIVTLPLEDYIAHVVTQEMNPGYYIYDGMTDAQKLTALKAQAIVARGYATYHLYVSRRHSTSEGFDFCDGTHCQAYTSLAAPTLAIQAANDTAKVIPAIVIDNGGSWIVNYIDCVFFASCLGSTKNAKDVWGTDFSYLRSVPCPYDLRPTEMLGHGVGFCQDGDAGYAKNTSLWPGDIIMHYYTGATTIVGTYH